MQHDALKSSNLLLPTNSVRPREPYEYSMQATEVLSETLEGKLTQAKANDADKSNPNISQTSMSRQKVNRA